MLDKTCTCTINLKGTQAQIYLNIIIIIDLFIVLHSGEKVGFQEVTVGMHESRSILILIQKRSYSHGQPCDQKQLKAYHSSFIIPLAQFATQDTASLQVHDPVYQQTCTRVSTQPYIQRLVCLFFVYKTHLQF